MARLFRPTIPVEIKCRVALRQLDEIGPDSVLDQWKRRHGLLLTKLLGSLAKNLGCEISELRLDHDPPLGARQQFKNGRGEVVRYVPDANSPDHLNYRPHGPEHAGSHLIKTNVRGEHGQHPDRVLIKKARRLERGPVPKRGRKIGSPGFYSRNDAKHKWPKRKFNRSKT